MSDFDKKYHTSLHFTVNLLLKKKALKWRVASLFNKLNKLEITDLLHH